LEAWVRAQAGQISDHFRHLTPKSAATANLVILLLITAGLSLWQPPFQPKPPVRVEKPLAPAPTAVKMIDAAPRASECREQTWPYLDRHCLNYGKAQPDTPVAATPRAVEAKPETSGRAPVTLHAPPIQETRIAPATPPVAAPPVPAQPNHPVAEQPMPSTDDVRVADDDEPVEYVPTEEELRAQARAEARQRRRARHRDFFRHGHFSIGPFRF
jgi:hypothetical protein